MKASKVPAPSQTRGPGQLRASHFAILLVPYMALLVPGFYARETPELAGVPFFYWYQFLWVILSASLTGVVYWRTRR